MTYARVIIVLHLYLLDQCLNPVLWTLIKTHIFFTFYKFLIHLGVHHTCFVLSAQNIQLPRTRGVLQQAMTMVNLAT
jgi:hypothetical protein